MTAPTNHSPIQKGIITWAQVLKQYNKRKPHFQLRYCWFFKTWEYEKKKGLNQANQREEFHLSRVNLKPLKFLLLLLKAGYIITQKAENVLGLTPRNLNKKENAIYTTPWSDSKYYFTRNNAIQKNKKGVPQAISIKSNAAFRLVKRSVFSKYGVVRFMASQKVNGANRIPRHIITVDIITPHGTQ